MNKDELSVLSAQGRIRYEDGEGFTIDGRLVIDEGEHLSCQEVLGMKGAPFHYKKTGAVPAAPSGPSATAPRPSGRGVTQSTATPGGPAGTVTHTSSGPVTSSSFTGQPGVPGHPDQQPVSSQPGQQSHPGQPGHTGQPGQPLHPGVPAGGVVTPGANDPPGGRITSDEERRRSKPEDR